MERHSSETSQYESRLCSKQCQVCINIAPWNAPATLSFGPTVSMLAAGNHVMLSVGLWSSTATVAAEYVLDSGQAAFWVRETRRWHPMHDLKQ